MSIYTFAALPKNLLPIGIGHSIAFEFRVSEWVQSACRVHWDFPWLHLCQSLVGHLCFPSGRIADYFKQTIGKSNHRRQAIKHAAGITRAHLRARKLSQFQFDQCRLKRPFVYLPAVVVGKTILRLLAVICFLYLFLSSSQLHCAIELSGSFRSKRRRINYPKTKRTMARLRQQERKREKSRKIVGHVSVNRDCVLALFARQLRLAVPVIPQFTRHAPPECRWLSVSVLCRSTHFSFHL